MKLHDFTIRMCKEEGLKKQVNIAQIKEILKATRKILKEEIGFDLYKTINSIK